MAAGAGIHLHRRRAGGAAALGILGRGLIAFDHADAHLTLQCVFQPIVDAISG